MNVFMWNHPITKIQLEILTNWNFKLINPIVKMLACGENGLII